MGAAIVKRLAADEQGEVRIRVEAIGLKCFKQNERLMIRKLENEIAVVTGGSAGTGLDSSRRLTTQDTIEGQQLSTPRAYKRSPALTNSTRYKGILVSHMAGTTDNNGAFDLMITKMRRGTEPPPHVHSREDELFCLLSGGIRVYVDGEVFPVTAGECMFLPRRKPMHSLLRLRRST
jgi:mannose-6-phosphate isomerase-like protein (cupin superfamily)